MLDGGVASRSDSRQSGRRQNRTSKEAKMSEDGFNYAAFLNDAGQCLDKVKPEDRVFMVGCLFIDVLSWHSKGVLNKKLSESLRLATNTILIERHASFESARLIRNLIAMAAKDPKFTEGWFDDNDHPTPDP
jgi:hypothetical protein